MSLLPIEHEPQDQALCSDIEKKNKSLDIKSDGILMICKKKKKD